jgi:hypothetical protein
MKSYEELLAERDALAHRLNDVSIACKVSNSLNDEILAERDALAAQNIKMMQAILYCTIYLDDNKLNSIATGSKAHNMLADAVVSTPQQCLAEIKAEAGRAGFVAGYHKMHIEFVGSPANGDGAEFAANQYAAKIRNAGTWLKDSNVNGGKRQGGAE